MSPPTTVATDDDDDMIMVTFSLRLLPGAQWLFNEYKILAYRYNIKESIEKAKTVILELRVKWILGTTNFICQIRIKLAKISLHPNTKRIVII